MGKNIENIETLNLLIEEGERIARRPPENLDAKWQETCRWNDRCRYFLKNHVSHEEAEKFSTLWSSISTTDKKTSFARHINKKIEFLKIIVNTIIDNPKFFAKKSLTIKKYT